AALGLPEHRVVGDGAAVGVVLAARREHHRVMPPLGVGQLDTIADVEWTGALHSSSACQQARRGWCSGLSEAEHRLSKSRSGMERSDPGKELRVSDDPD